MDSPDVGDSEVVRAALQPLLDWRLREWRGLPRLRATIFENALGPSERREPVLLGRFPARREIFRIESPSGGVAVYSRNDEVLLVETLIPPPLSAMEGLEAPTAIMPHEILDQHGYVHEYLYAQRGLVLGIAEPFDRIRSLKIIRCRGFQPVRDAADFGPDLYMPFEDRIAFDDEEGLTSEGPRGWVPGPGLGPGWLTSAMVWGTR